MKNIYSWPKLLKKAIEETCKQQNVAAAKLGVRISTLNGWLKGRGKPLEITKEAVLARLYGNVFENISESDKTFFKALQENMYYYKSKWHTEFEGKGLFKEFIKKFFEKDVDVIMGWLESEDTAKKKAFRTGTHG